MWLCPFSPGTCLGKGEVVQPSSGRERIGQCRGKSQEGKEKETVCAILGACLIQAQDHYKDFIKQELEIDCLKNKLKREEEHTHL